jgi:hypothetical protein
MEGSSKISFTKKKRSIGPKDIADVLKVDSHLCAEG